jgi:hypothetical protein
MRAGERFALMFMNTEMQKGIAFLHSKSRQVILEPLRLKVATVISRS